MEKNAQLLRVTKNYISIIILALMVSKINENYDVDIEYYIS